MNPVKIPCERDCPDRSPDCHGWCEKYASFRAAVEAQKQQARKTPVEQYQSQRKKRRIRAEEYRRQKGNER